MRYRFGFLIGVIASAAAEPLTKPDNSTIAHSLMFGYDSLSQLTSATMYRINGTQTWTGDYSYQRNGDMSQKTVNSEQPTGYTYTGNEMITAGGSNLSYDLNGNLTNDEIHFTRYDYNWDNKLRSAVIGANSISLKYDPSGNRIAKNSSVAGNAKYIVDATGSVPKILLVLDAVNNAILKKYIHTDSEVLMQEDNLSHRYYYLHDRLGSVRLIVDETGAVKNCYTYDPYGKAVELQETISNDYRFAGYFWDNDMGMYYCIARQYSPELMRFTTYDPVAGKFETPLTFNKYLYCGNSPVTFIDPDGREIRLGWAKPVDYKNQEDYHTLLQIIPENQAQYFTAFGSEEYFNIDTMQIEFTIDACPSSYFKAVTRDNWAYLKSRISGPGSEDYYPNARTYGFEKLDLGENEDYVISALLGAYNYYTTEKQTGVGYAIWPVGGDGGGYNSNSFTHGLLNAVGLECYYGPPVSDPGWYKPLPEEYFKKN